jgi:AcrR family transcriptional regulator
MPSGASRIQPPLQERSRRTLENICQAVETLLGTYDFDDISIADIVREAGCSTGSFYARFGSKDDLLPYLYERYDNDLRPRIAARMAANPIGSMSLRETVRAVVDHTIDMYAERRHLLRAMVIYARTRPREISPSTRQAREGTTDMPASAIARFATDIRHDNAMEAARIGFFVMSAAAREKILFDAPQAASLRISRDRLKRELAHGLFAYLTTAPGD